MISRKKIGVLGSIAIDNIFNANSVPTKGERVYGELLGSYIGGMAANQAVEAARYLDSVYLLGQIGRDEVGGRITEHLENLGCKTELLKRNGETTTGQTFMYLVDGNSNYFSIVIPGSNMINDSQTVIQQLSDLDVLLISLEISIDVARQAIEFAKNHGIYVYLCPSPAESCEKSLLDKADALILNEREADILLNIHGDTIEEIENALQQIHSNHELIVVSLGDKGALLKDEETIYYAKGLKVNAIDTVGAGDAFTGAFVAAREMGMDSYQALCYGCIAGAFTVSVVGAESSTHTQLKVEENFQKYYQKE